MPSCLLKNKLLPHALQKLPALNKAVKTLNLAEIALNLHAEPVRAMLRCYFVFCTHRLKLFFVGYHFKGFGGGKASAAEFGVGGISAFRQSLYNLAPVVKVKGIRSVRHTHNGGSRQKRNFGRFKICERVHKAYGLILLGHTRPVVEKLVSAAPKH